MLQHIKLMENQISSSKNKAHLLGPHEMKGTSVLG